MKNLVFVIILFIIACTPSTKSDVGISENLDPNLKLPKIKKEDFRKDSNTADSLRNPFHQAYYSDISIEEFGYLVLQDSVSPMDNEITFRLMDSIMSNSKETRNFYYPIFQHISEKSDGSLAEVIGSYGMIYAQNYPDEFYNRYKCCDSVNNCCDQLVSMAKFIQYEIGMQENIEVTYQTFLDSIETPAHNYLNDHLSMILIENVTNGLSEYLE